MKYSNAEYAVSALLFIAPVAAVAIAPYFFERAKQVEAWENRVNAPISALPGQWKKVAMEQKGGCNELRIEREVGFAEIEASRRWALISKSQELRDQTELKGLSGPNALYQQFTMNACGDTLEQRVFLRGTYQYQTYGKNRRTHTVPVESDVSAIAQIGSQDVSSVRDALKAPLHTDYFSVMKSAFKF